MKAIAKVTSHMEDCVEDIWIVKGKTYNLEQANEPIANSYVFTDEKGDEHYIDICDFDKYFKEDK